MKMGWIKNSFETTVTNYDSKENCKTTIYDGGFKDIFETLKLQLSTVVLYTWKKIYVDAYVIQKITLTNILRWVLFLPFFSTNELFGT